jgi:hypothetical protein
VSKETPKLQQTISSDAPVETSKKVATELAEEQLDKVSGGTLSLAHEEVKFEYTAQGSGGTAAPRRSTGSTAGDAFHSRFSLLFFRRDELLDSELDTVTGGNFFFEAAWGEAKGRC